MPFGGVAWEGSAPIVSINDVINGGKRIKSARIANEKINKVIKSLNLRLNEDKPSFIVMASKKQTCNITRELKINPLLCGGCTTQI